MLENRSLKADLFAVALLAVVVFLAVSLCTYDPADPLPSLLFPLDRLYQPDVLVFPANAEVRNACGIWGALSADILFRSVGLSAFYVVASLAVVDILLLRRRSIDTPVVRSCGWLLSLVGLAAIVGVAGEGLVRGPAIGPGGYLGVLIRHLLEMHFATAGALMLAFSFFISGLLLCTDYAMLRIGAAIATFSFAGLSRLSRQLPARRKKSDRRRSDLDSEQEDDEEEDSFEDDDALNIKVGGKRATQNPFDEPQPAESGGTEFVAESETSDEQSLVIKKRAGRHQAKEKQAKEDAKRREVMAELNKASRTEEAANFELPDLELLTPADDFCFDEQEKEIRRKARILEKTFANFGLKVKVVEIESGPVIAQYEIELEAGLRLSKITGLADDLAIALRVPSVRIVAPIPGKNTVGIEVPNEQRQVVRLREVIEEALPKCKKMMIPLFLGKDVSGNPLAVDLATLPHLLIAGRTGTGKSVCLNAIISSILMTRRPDEVRMLMIDPKMVELSGYGRLPHLMHPVVTDMKKAEAILAWAVEKMEERYSLLAKAGVRHISSYNQLGEEELMDRLQPETDEERESIPLTLPFIVIVADEMADLMMTAGKEVEQHIIRLAQKSRAVGIHLILATQKPTVDVITGLIKSNLPARISFQVASRTDSRVVLDEMGADKLLGNGDMLFLWPGTSKLLRGQGTYLHDDEIDAVVDFVSTGEQNFVHELVNMKVEEDEGDNAPGQLKKRDDLYESAVDVVVREGRGSVSLLQRALGIGYGRAARMIDWMAEDNVVGAYAGSQAREVLISVAEWERMQGYDPDESSEEPERGVPRLTVSMRDADQESDDDDPDFDYDFEEDEAEAYGQYASDVG